MTKKFEFRKWQKNAIKIVERVAGAVTPEIIPVNACVGSGKTNVGYHGLGEFIFRNFDSKTVQGFIAPRIRLCDQQGGDGLVDYLRDHFGLEVGRDYSIVTVHCKDKTFDKSSTNLTSKHTIFIICDESLWGAVKGDNVDPMARWHGWMSKFKAWKGLGFKFGFMVMDEAHNYEHNVDKIIGDGKNPCLFDYFHLMLMSGTPAKYQKDLSNGDWKDNVAKCSPKEAIADRAIVKPTLNVCLADEKQWPSIVASVINREIDLCESTPFPVRDLVNFTSIDEIRSFENFPGIKERIGKNFHFLGIHSDKSFIDETGGHEVYPPTLDGAEIDADKAYEIIEKIDGSDKNPPYFNDGLPVIVAQVAMIGEGINVKSFNSIITSTNSDKTAMQQIGRAMRNWTVKDDAGVEHQKTDEGHANVYIMTSNFDSISTLLSNLNEFELTSDCYEWGKVHDFRKGSSSGSGDEDPLFREQDWVEIDKVQILTVQEETDGKIDNLASKNLTNELKSDPVCMDIIKEIASKMLQNKTWMKAMGFGGSNSSSKSGKTGKKDDSSKKMDKKQGKSDKQKDANNKKETDLNSIIFKMILEAREFIKTHKDIDIFAKALETTDGKNLVLRHCINNDDVAELTMKLLGERNLWDRFFGNV